MKIKLIQLSDEKFEELKNVEVGEPFIDAILHAQKTYPTIEKELKPCPFCLGDELAVETDDYNRATISCNRCDVYMVGERPKDLITSILKSDQAFHDVIDKWNGHKAEGK